MRASLTILPTNTIRDAMSAIDQNARGIVLVVDANSKLLATVTDGDLRRALLDGVSLDEAVSEVISGRHGERFPSPIVAAVDTPKRTLLQLMQKSRIEQIPLLDNQGRVVDLVTLHDLLPAQDLSVNAVVMAGGLGKRLQPLTNATPKPMLPVGDRPILQHIVEQLRDSGIRNISLSVNYEAEQITQHFNDGSSLGVDISYLHEDSPLGTAGSLSLLPRPEQPLLVMNGDILTKVDFRALLAYHRSHQASVTVSVRKYELAVPYGVVESSGSSITSIREKPTIGVFVNAGIYLLEPHVLDLVPSGQRFDMPELINLAIQARLEVAAFPIWEHWLDIGEPVHYLLASASA